MEQLERTIHRCAADLCTGALEIRDQLFGGEGRIVAQNMIQNRSSRPGKTMALIGKFGNHSFGPAHIALRIEN